MSDETSRSGGPSVRRFRAYNVGIPKTGSTSMAGIFSRYRSAHEFMFAETVRTLAAHARGTLDAAELRRFVLRRDELGNLEMDSATFAFAYVDILVDLFPDARFILTIRDPRSWLTSFLNMLLSLEVRLPSWLVEYGGTILGSSFAHESAGSEDGLRDHLSEFVDYGLAYWAHANGILLATLPPDRRLIVRTDEISGRIDEIGAFVGVPALTLVAVRSHLFKAQRHVDFLGELDPGWLCNRIDEHCGSLMAGVGLSSRRSRPHERR